MAFKQVLDENGNPFKIELSLSNQALIETVANNELNINNVASNISNVDTVASNMSSVVSVKQDVVPNLAAILATPQKALEAANSANSASASALALNAYKNLDWAGFTVNSNSELLVDIFNGATSTPSLVDGDFIITY